MMSQGVYSTVHCAIATGPAVFGIQVELRWKGDLGRFQAEARESRSGCAIYDRLQGCGLTSALCG